MSKATTPAMAIVATAAQIIKFGLWLWGLRGLFVIGFSSSLYVPTAATGAAVGQLLR